MSFFPSTEHRKLLLTTLRLMGVHRVYVAFSGGGDSGSIDTPVAKDKDENMLDLGATIVWPKASSAFRDGSWQVVSTEEQQTIEDVLRHLTEDALDAAGIDWYNNDGGQGELQIDFFSDPPGITLDVGVNVTTTDNHSFDFSDEFTEDACTPATTA